MEKNIARMSLKEKCAQIIAVDYRFDKADPERILRLVKGGIGGVCFFQGNVYELPSLVNSLQNEAKVPLLMSADYEHGVGQQVSGATPLPTNMAVGATGSEDLARRKGRVTAVESRALGVPWVLAPVVDLQSNPKNPIINTRAFGEDVDLVTRLARAFAQGVREGGGLNCAKHFPGHGDTSMDSHVDLPVDDRPGDDLRARDLRPYAALRDDVDSVMTGHLLVRAFDAERPASLSPKITAELLRREIGFGGLICTDAFQMGGITRHTPEPQALVQAVEAGADVILFPVEPELAAGVLVDAVEDGRLSEKRVDDAVERIFSLKDRAGLFETRHTDPNRVEGLVGCEEHREAARRIAEAAVTKVRDPRSVLPLSGDVSCTAVGDGNADAFREALGAGEGEVRVAAVFARPRAWTGRAELDENQIARVRELSPAVVVSFGSPYVIHQVPESAAFVCVYSEDEASQRAAARALRGEIPFRGKLPVSLERDGGP